MKLSSKTKATMDSLSTENKLLIHTKYKKASITNFRYSSPLSNPENFNVYAEIRDSDGELLVSATLEHCSERMAEAAYISAELFKAGLIPKK